MGLSELLGNRENHKLLNAPRSEVKESESHFRPPPILCFYIFFSLGESLKKNRFSSVFSPFCVSDFKAQSWENSEGCQERRPKGRRAQISLSIERKSVTMRKRLQGKMAFPNFR